MFRISPVVYLRVVAIERNLLERVCPQAPSGPYLICGFGKPDVGARPSPTRFWGKSHDDMRERRMSFNARLDQYGGRTRNAPKPAWRNHRFKTWGT